jgi:hypothetical protein
MLCRVKELWNYRIEAADHEIGRLYDFFLDDETWAICYLVVDTGTWLPGRKVLISPVAIGHPDGDWRSSVFYVKLTKQQVQASPDIDVHKPISRQQEIALREHYGWAHDRDTAGVDAAPVVSPSSEKERKKASTNSDPHLRSTREICGYSVRALDGAMGHLEDLIMDEARLTIRYAVVKTRNWLPGKRVLLSPESIARVRWNDRSVYFDLTRRQIKDSSLYNPSVPLHLQIQA